MAKDFKALLRSLSQALTQPEKDVIVEFARLPDELKLQPAYVVLERVVGDGKLSARNLEVIMDTMVEIGRNDLYTEAKAFKKKSQKILSEGVSPDSKESFHNFDVAESEAIQLRNTLQKMDGSEAINGVKRIEEVYTEAREAAENLVRLIRRANCLSRTLGPASVARQSSDHCGSPPLTSSTECSDFPEPSPPVTGGLIERLSRKMSKNTKNKTKGKQNEPASSQNSQRKLNRSVSEMGTDKTNKQKTRGPTKSAPPTRGGRVARPDHSDSEDSLDYQLPDGPSPPKEPVRFAQTLPRQVPQRQQPPISAHPPILTSTSPRNSFAMQSKAPDTMTVKPPPPPSEPLEPDDDMEYVDVDIFAMQMQRKSSQGNSKPQSLLHSDGSRALSSRNDTSSTCSTPSSELSTPPAPLPKPITKGRSTSDTPAIPIRRSSLNSKSGSTSVGPSSVPSGSVHSASDNTPNTRMVDIQQQLKETFRFKQMAGSPQGPASRVSPHPVSLARALEMSQHQAFGPEYNDCCTEDSGFDEYPPVSTSWQRTAPPTKPKTKVHKPSSPPLLQSYANVDIIDHISHPTSPQSAPQHTTISRLGPTYTTHATTPSPPTAGGHTSVSDMAPMYKCISIEEKEPEEDDEGCPDYINVKTYVPPV